MILNSTNLNVSRLDQIQVKCDISARFLSEIMIRLGPALTVDYPDTMEVLMATARAVSIHVTKITSETRKYLLKLVESYAHCWDELDSHTQQYYQY